MKMAGAGSSNTMDKYPEFRFYKPDDMKGESIWKFIYNSKDKTFLGRTRWKWGVCLLFYIVFYSSLALMWMIMLFVALKIYWSNEGPWLTLDQSILGGNPALVHYPPDDTISLRGNELQFTGPIEKFLSRYQNTGDYSDCTKSPSSPENCYFDVKELGNCSLGGSFGYFQNSPCVLFKLNKLYSWKPIIYKDAEELPDEAPTELKNYINQQDSKKRNMIWLSCSEEKGSSLKELHYWPGQGFLSSFYPLKENEERLSPIVATKFVSKESGISMKIKCQAWAKGMKSTTTFTIQFR